MFVKLISSIYKSYISKFRCADISTHEKKNALNVIKKDR